MTMDFGQIGQMAQQQRAQEIQRKAMEHAEHRIAMEGAILSATLVAQQAQTAAAQAQEEAARCEARYWTERARREDQEHQQTTEAAEAMAAAFGAMTRG